MTNTKEYNEAVEKLASIINKKRAFVPKFDDYEPIIQEGLRDTIKTIINALGIEIVSRRSNPQINDLIDGIRIGHVQEVDEDSIYVDVHGGSWEMDKDVKIIQRNTKPAVYLENIKGAE